MSKVQLLTFLGCGGIFSVSIIGGLWVFERLFKWDGLPRLMASAIPLSSAYLLLLTVGQCLSSLLPTGYWGNWNPARLLPSFALARGIPIYGDPTSGVVTGMIYGPLMAIAYLPATIANTPTQAVLLGQCLSIFFYFSPILWLHLKGNWRDRHRLVLALTAFICFYCFTLYLPPLTYVAFGVHADAPALGLSAAACAILFSHKNRSRFLPCLISAIVAIAAVWTKQVTLPLLFALPTYIFLADGWRNFWRYTVCLISSGLIISGFLLVMFNPENLLFNILTVPSHHPLGGDGGIKILIQTLSDLFDLCLIPAIMVGFAIAYQLYIRANYKKPRIWLRHNPWMMLTIVSIFMTPLSVLGKIKVGGHVNQFSFTIYFMVAATTLILLNFATNANYPQATQKSAQLITSVLVLVLFCTQIPPPVATVFRELENLPNNLQQSAYAYAASHPNEAYFPWNPLSNLMAENHLYHFDYGLFDRELAGFPVTEEHFQAHIPRDIQLVAVPPAFPTLYIKKFLPEFSYQVEIEELPNFTVYSRQP